MDKNDNCLQVGNALKVNKEDKSLDANLQRPQMTVMPQKTGFDDSDSNSSTSIMNESGYSQKSHYMEDTKIKSNMWSGFADRVEMLRGFFRFLGLALLIPFLFNLVVMEMLFRGDSCLLMLDGAWVITLIILSLGFFFIYVMMREIVLPYIRLKVRRVHCFGWSGFASVILPVIIPWWLSIGIGAMSLVLLLFAIPSLPDEGMILLIIFVAAFLIWELWIACLWVVFPFFEEVKYMGKRESQFNQNFTIAALLITVLLFVVLGVVIGTMPRSIDEVFRWITSAGKIVAEICCLWSIVVLLFCLFRKGRSI